MSEPQEMFRQEIKILRYGTFDIYRLSTWAESFVKGNSHRVEKFLASYGTYSFTPCMQKSVTGPNSESYQFNPHPHHIFILNNYPVTLTDF